MVFSTRVSKLIPVQVVELLFGRGLVKVLFATETFAMVSVRILSSVFHLTSKFRVSICLQNALCFHIYGNMMGEASEIFCQVNTRKWPDVQDGEASTQREL